MTDAMTKQLIAERKRRSIVLQADGSRQAAVLNSVAQATVDIINAEAVRQVQIVNAETEAKIKITQAKSDAESLALVQKALQESNSHISGVDYMLRMRYLGELSVATFKTITMVQEGQLEKFK